MRGDFPPNSKVVLLIPPFINIFFPTSVDPVKAILSTSLLLTSASPASSPNPGSIFTTPSGKLHSNNNSPILSAVKGVYSAGFRIIVFPPASAGAIFIVAIKIGKFQGVIDATTPTGSYLV